MRLAPDGTGGTDRRGTAERLTRVLEQLEATDLRPSPVVDQLFGELVDLACAMPREAVAELPPGTTRRARRVSARGEALLEEHWAQRIAAGRDPVAAFPYAAQYARLVSWEYRLLRSLSAVGPRRVLVTGSGPLPLTALVLAEIDPGTRIVCLDRDAAALAHGEKVAARVLDDPSQLTFVAEDAVAHDYGGVDIIVVAALVGQAPGTKSAVLHRVAATMTPGGLVAARSVPDDGRTLLYRRIDPAHTPPGLDVLGEHAPPRGIVNSLLVLRPVPRVRTAA